ncbi:MAG TPA: SCP2 sterol-binding domain-containing protein [Spirochaetota bacterium]|nr:SCP2 sterol-binding domain-containing protein [Spirochaetota bacterium]HPI91465.1 SCP2 sterol-binding domain-containing protein [Spirochaetota bacterium]HPR48102.1 SCP2 sterol-binding domain-containing protein [Spirochaetota bacterium]
MKFSLLLFMLSFMLKSKSKKESPLKNKLREKNMTMLIRTQKGDRARFFTIKDGAVVSGRGVVPSPDVALVWKDAETGFSVMTSRDKEAPIKALGDGRLKIEGSAELALWFMGAVAVMMKGAKK